MCVREEGMRISERKEYRWERKDGFLNQLGHIMCERNGNICEQKGTYGNRKTDL